ncbi:hypothetical protein D3C80_734720 [compost metagenome]
MNQRIGKCFLNKFYFIDPFVFCKMGKKKVIKMTCVKIPMGHITYVWAKWL